MERSGKRSTLARLFRFEQKPRAQSQAVEAESEWSRSSPFLFELTIAVIKTFTGQQVVHTIWSRYPGQV